MDVEIIVDRLAIGSPKLFQQIQVCRWVGTDDGAITVTFDVVVMKIVISMTVWLSAVNIVDSSIDV